MEDKTLSNQPAPQQRSNRTLYSIIAALGVALLLAIIGLVVMALRPNSQSQQKKADTSQQAPAVAAAPTTYKAAIDTSFGYPLTFTFPEKWTIAQGIAGPMPPNAGQGATTQSIVLTSPSGNVSVTYKIGANNPKQAACNEKTIGQFAEVATKSVPGLSIVNFVEYTVRNYSEAYPNGPYYAGLMETNTARIFAPGASLCTAHGANTVKLVDSNAVQLLDASIFIKGIHTVNDFATAQKTNEYIEATKILLSTVH